MENEYQKLLENEAFVDKLKIVIEESKEKYKETNLGQWENLKFEIAQFCNEQSISISRQRKQTIQDLNEKLIQFEEYCAFGVDNVDEINETKHQMCDYYKEVAESSKFRCKARWYHGGRKTRNIFLT